MPAQRSQRSTHPAAAAIDLVVEDRSGDTFGIAVWSLCASILPGRQTSQRSHTIRHKSVLRIDSRTAR